MGRPLITTCRICGVDQEKRLLELRTLASQKVRGVYVGHDGRQWKGGTCPDCAGGPTKRGRPNLTPDTSPTLSVSRRAEWLVCEWIRENWKIDVTPSTKFNGPDIVLPNGECVEVKRVCKDDSISELTPERQRDRWLALVWYETDVVMLPMFAVIQVPLEVTKLSTQVGRFRPQVAA